MLMSESVKSMKTSAGITRRKGEGLSDASNLPSDDDINNLLHRLRPFILQKEPYYFPKVKNILRKNLKHDESQNALVALRDLFTGKTFQEKVEIKSDKETIINSENVLKDWLNSSHYHRNADKRELINRLGKMWPGNFMEGVFVHMLFDKTKAIKHLSAIIEILVDPEQ